MASCPRWITPSDFAHAEHAARVHVSRVRTKVPNELATTLSPSKSSYLAFVLTILGSVDLMDRSSEDARDTLSSIGTSDGAVSHLYLSTALRAFTGDILNFTLARSLATLAIFTADSAAAESDDCEMSLVTEKPHAPSLNALDTAATRQLRGDGLGLTVHHDDVRALRRFQPEVGELGP